MARLHVQIWMVDNDGRRRLEVELDEPTRFDVDRDPLYVFGRLTALAERGLEAIHDQALRLDRQTDRGRSATP